MDGSESAVMPGLWMNISYGSIRTFLSFSSVIQWDHLWREHALQIIRIRIKLQ